MAKRTTPSGANGSPAERYLAMTQRRIRSIRRDIPPLVEMGEKMAAPILQGGRLFVPPVADFWPSEFSSRAGGFMGLVRQPDLKPSRANDVAYVALPDPAGWNPATDKTLASLLRGRAQLFVNGRADELEALGDAVKGVAAFTGGAPAGKGPYALGDRRPLVNLRHFDQFVRGWMAAGELIAACTRQGKMPTIYMSVLFEGAMIRNTSFVEHHNLSVDWSAPFFHRDFHVPPLEPGYAATAFLKTVEEHLGTLRGQLPLLARAGQWMAEARAAKRRIWAVACGHSYPAILELPDDGSYPIEWGRSTFNLRKALPSDLRSGDVALHLGYGPVNVADIVAVVKRGIRLIITSPYGRPPILEDHPNLLWFDLPWQLGDATVDVPGYSVRILPVSSTCHTMAYFAILSEMAERMGWT